MASNSIAPLYTERYDLGILGGGIAGAAVARDAALRGLRVILFEKGDFGSGTSSKSSKLIHGGIRYLELSWNALLARDFREALKNFRFVLASLRESRILARIAPVLIRPLPLLVPVYDSDRRGRGTVFTGALFYWLLAVLTGGGRFPTLYPDKEAVLRAMPELNPAGLQAAVKIWDHVVDDRALVEATIASAKKSGARCLDHVEVTGYEYRAQGDSFFVRIAQKDSHGEIEVKRLVDATGPWIDRTRASAGEGGEAFLLPLAGAHIELPAFLPMSALLQARDGRFFFVIQWRGRSRVGTTERVVEGPEGVQATEKEVEYLLSALKRYFPRKDFKKEDILSRDAGVRPLPASSRDPHTVSREHEIRRGPTGCLHLVGVKLTDHRRAAQKAVDRLMPEFLAARPELRARSSTADLPL